MSTGLREMSIGAPVEFRLFDREGTMKYVLTVQNVDGMLRHNLTSPNGSTPHSISNIQSNSVYPRKAVSGWQYEWFCFAQAGLYGVGVVR